MQNRKRRKLKIYAIPANITKVHKQTKKAGSFDSSFNRAHRAGNNREKKSRGRVEGVSFLNDYNYFRSR